MPRAHAWIWTVLPAAVQRVAVHGDPGLVTSLNEAGLTAAESALGDRADGDATVIRLSAARALRTALRPRLPEGPLILIGGGGRPQVRDPVGRLRRAAELAGALLSGAGFGLAVRRLATWLRRRNRRAATFPIGDRSRNSYRIGYRALRPPKAAAGWVLATGIDAASPVDLSLERAGRDLGTQLTPVRITAVETGKLLIEAQGSDRRRFMLRLAAAPGRRLLENGLAALDRITAPGVDPIVKERVVAPLARGEVGRLLYAAEPLMSGTAPRVMTATLWDDCIEFLAHLLRIEPVVAAASSELATAARLIADFVDGRGDRQWLTELGCRLDERLAEMPRGWEHGDFWVENILVESGRLASVLDWDTARPAALPLLDMFDLISLSEPGRTSLFPGQRLKSAIWPLIAGDPDARLLRYCAAVGLDADAGQLGDLARAYWLNRVARDLTEVPDRRRRGGWLAANIAEPIRFLRSVSEPGIGSGSATLS